MTLTVDASLFVARFREEDAFYVALAKETRSVLVTTDVEILRSASASVKACSLSEWLKAST